MNVRPIFLAFDDLEVEFLRINDLTDGCASLIFKLHRDQNTDDLFNAFRHRKGKRFKVSGVQIGDDEQPVPQPAEERADESTLNSGDNSTQRQPASVTGEPPARVKSLYGERGGRRRNDAQYQGFIFSVSHIILQNETGIVAPMNPVERRKLVAELQHKWCRVASLADIMPGTEEELRFNLLETAFAADGRGLDPSEIMTMAS